MYIYIYISICIYIGLPRTARSGSHRHETHHSNETMGVRGEASALLVGIVAVPAARSTETLWTCLIYLSTYLSIYLSVYLSVCLSVYLSGNQLSILLSMYPSIFLSINQSKYASINLYLSIDIYVSHQI